MSYVNTQLSKGSFSSIILHKDGINTTLSDGGDDQLHQLRLSQMNVHVRRGRQLQPLCSFQLHFGVTESDEMGSEARWLLLLDAIFFVL